jgi:hypothetical protein
MSGMSPIDPSRSTLTEPPPSGSGHWIRKVVSYTVVQGRPSLRTARVVSKLETMRPSHPPPAPAQIDPGRKSMHPSARQPE